MRKMLDGFVVDDRRGERKDGAASPGAVEILEHRFETCVCGRHTMMLMAGETLPTKCPQDDWQWGYMMPGPMYPSGIRTLATQDEEADNFNERSTEQMMMQLAQQMRHRGIGG